MVVVLWPKSMMTLGAAFQISPAIRSSVFAGIPVIFSCHCAVVSLVASTTLSNPIVNFSIKSLSYVPFLIHVWMRAKTNARSVPGFTGSHSSAFEATTLKRGSKTSSFVSSLAAILASFLASAMTIPSKRLCPKFTTYFALPKSLFNFASPYICVQTIW